MSSHTATEASGTVTYLDKPNSSSELATPAKIAMTFDKLAATNAAIMKKVVRRPNSSRIRSLRPLPVTAPMREHISWVTINRIVIGNRVQSGR
jgi:hypothetical protein